MKTVTIYSIVHTYVDADHGEFPPPSLEGSFLTLEQAQEEMERLIKEEIEKNNIPLCKKNCRIDSGPDYWEAYEDGYAAACSSRYDIMSSELVLEEDCV